MRKTIEAVYENGVLRLLSPLVLPEQERVSVTIETDSEEWVDAGAMELALSEHDADMSLDDLRQRLSASPGNWSEDVIAERGDY